MHELEFRRYINFINNVFLFCDKDRELCPIKTTTLLNYKNNQLQGIQSAKIANCSYIQTRKNNNMNGVELLIE